MLPIALRTNPEKTHPIDTTITPTGTNTTSTLATRTTITTTTTTTIATTKLSEGDILIQQLQEEKKELQSQIDEILERGK